MRRDPHYFLPTTGKRYLLFGSDQAAMKRQFLAFFSEADWRANQALQAEIAQLRDDVAPTWLEEPLSIEETAERYVRARAAPDLRRSVPRPVARVPRPLRASRATCSRRCTRSPTASRARTAPGTRPGTGMNFLVHNMCRLPGADGTWMIVAGGMGTVTHAARRSWPAQRGAKIVTGARCRRSHRRRGGVATGVALADGEEIARHGGGRRTPTRSACATLVGSARFPADWNAARRRVPTRRAPPSR